MKKLLLSCFALMCCLSTFSQITFTVSKTTAVSGDEISITSSGESHTLTPGSKYIASVGPFSVKSANPSSYFANQSIQWTDVSYYYPNYSSPTVMKVKVKNTASVPVTVTYKFQVNTNDYYANKPLPPYDYEFTVTVNPAPIPVVYNTEQYNYYVKNNCTAAGTTGTSVKYVVPAKKYSAPTLEEANNKAINDLLANGQNYANANGTCVIDNDVHLYYSNSGAYPGSKIARLIIKNSSGAVQYDFDETALRALPKIAPGIYTFEFTTVGPMVTGNTGWKLIAVATSPNVGQVNDSVGYEISDRIYNNGGTTYVLSNFNTTNIRSFRLDMLFFEL